jgi:hypothetical protein
MLELEKFGLVEMSSVEVNEVEGGFLPFALVLAWYLLGPYGTHKAY